MDNAIVRKQAEAEAADLVSLMETIEGRRFVWRFLSNAGIFRQSYIGDANDTVFNEGRRSLGLWLYAELQQHCPEKYLEMQREATVAAQRLRQEIEAYERNNRDD